jgi:hypothetical protein
VNCILSLFNFFFASGFNIVSFKLLTGDGLMQEKKPENKKQNEDEQKAKVNPIHPGDQRVRPKRHLLDTCE